MWEKLYTSSRLTQTSTYYSWRENVQILSLPNKTARKDYLTSHQRVRTSDLALNRKRKASEAQLSPERINLRKETQQPAKLKRKITHQGNSFKKFIIIKVMLLKSVCLFPSSCNTLKSGISLFLCQ